jgi:hypothetical protein
MRAKAVNAAAGAFNGSCVVRQPPDPPHTFWTPPSPLSKSVARDQSPLLRADSASFWRLDGYERR